MEMTKERLASYRSNKQEIKELDWMLNNRWKSESMVGNDVVFDYSKGYPMPQSVVGFDQKKYERLQNRDLRRKTHLEKENEEIEDFVSQIHKWGKTGKAERCGKKSTFGSKLCEQKN